MNRSKFGLKTLGVCVIALLGLTAFMAASAQAEWLVGNPGKKLVGTKELKGKAHTEGILSVPSKNLKILCLAVAAGAGSKISEEPLSFVLGNLNFTECRTEVSNVVNAGCKPAEPVKAVGKGTGILHNGENYYLLASDEEVSAGVFRFARIDFPAGTCALPDTNVSGSLVIECLTAALSTAGNCLEHTASHLVQQAPQALFPTDELLYGVNAATISGIANVELTTGELWSCHV